MLIISLVATRLAHLFSSERLPVDLGNATPVSLLLTGYYFGRCSVVQKQCNSVVNGFTRGVEVCACGPSKFSELELQNGKYLGNLSNGSNFIIHPLVLCVQIIDFDWNISTIQLVATYEKNIGILGESFSNYNTVTPTTLRCFSDSSTQRCNIGYKLVSFSDIVTSSSTTLPPVSTRQRREFSTIKKYADKGDRNST